MFVSNLEALRIRKDASPFSAFPESVKGTSQISQQLLIILSENFPHSLSNPFLGHELLSHGYAGEHLNCALAWNDFVSCPKPRSNALGFHKGSIPLPRLHPLLSLSPVCCRCWMCSCFPAQASGNGLRGRCWCGPGQGPSHCPGHLRVCLDAKTPV